MNNSDSHLGKKSGILKTPQSPQYTGGEEHRDQSSDVFEHIQVRTTPNIPTLPPSTDSMPHFSGALSGLPNVAELPAPEALAATDIVADADFSAISVFLGEYRACCLMSKNWALREAALAKTRLWTKAAGADLKIWRIFAALPDSAFRIKLLRCI